MRRPLPEVDSRRVVRRFALFPRTVEHTWIWLEFYYVNQHYTDLWCFNSYNWRDMLECLTRKDAE